MLTLDIINLYTNIPNNQVINIVRTTRKADTQLDLKTQEEILDVISST
jgi:hypothetical protein